MNKKADLVSNYFTSIYLTFIALLQGVALVHLVPNMITYFDMVDDPWTNIHTVLLLITLLINFLVWHHYVNGIVYLRWFPNILDAIIPFVVTITQLFLVSYLVIKTNVSDIQMAAWSKTFAFFLFAGSLAYFAASWRHETDLFTNIMSRHNAAIHSRNIRRYYNAAGLSMIFQGLFAFVILFLHANYLLTISLCFFIIHIVASEYFHLKRIKPHFIKAMDEYEE